MHFKGTFQWCDFYLGNWLAHSACSFKRPGIKKVITIQDNCVTVLALNLQAFVPGMNAKPLLMSPLAWGLIRPEIWLNLKIALKDWRPRLLPLIRKSVFCPSVRLRTTYCDIKRPFDWHTEKPATVHCFSVTCRGVRTHYKSSQNQLKTFEITFNMMLWTSNVF